MRSGRRTRLFLTTLSLAGLIHSALAGDPAGILIQPAWRTVLEGCPATFTVGVTGTPPISLQWLRDDLPLPGETNSSLTIRAAFVPDDGARFRVSVSNAFGGDLSAEALLHIVLDVTPPALQEAGGDATRTRVFVRFRGGACGGFGMDRMSAEDPLNYSLSGGLMVFDAVLDASGSLVTLTTSQQTPDALYTLTVQGVADIRGNNVAPGSTATFRARAPRAQALLFESFRRPSCGVVPCQFFEWTTNLQDELFLSAFDTRDAYPDDSRENYTARVSGYFVPPISGNWIFYLRSDDDSRLYLGTNGLDPNGVRLIVQEPGCCRPFSANPSPAVALRANQPYYIEGLYREHTGSDYLQVAARLEGDPTMPDALPPIPSEYLMPFLDSAAGLISIQNQPRDVVVLLNAPATFTVTATAANLNPDFPLPFLHYQWQRLASDSFNWVDLPGATNSSYTTPPRTNCDLERYRCRLYAAGATTLTAEATSLAIVDESPLLLGKVFAGPSLREVTVVFSEFVTQETAGDPFNYAIDGLTIDDASVLSGTAVRLRTDRQTPGATYTLVVNNVRNLGPPSCGGQEISPNTTARFQAWELVRGAARRELYFGIFGATIQDLRASPRFPNAPDVAEYSGAVDGGTDRWGLDLADNYGMRITGYLLPPVTQNYDFYLASDDQGEFWLSTDEDPAHLAPVCRESANNGWRQWAGPLPNPATPPESWSRASFPNGIPLSASNPYYFEVLMKEGFGTDHVGVAWTRAGDPVPASGSPPIAGEFLAVVSPRIDVHRSGDLLVISWTLGGVLQSAPTVNGPWTDETFATNPLTVPSSPAPQFYRAVFEK